MIVPGRAIVYAEAMSRHEIDLPDDLADWIGSRVSEGRYESVGDYFIALVRRDRDDNDDDALARLRAAIEVGARSEISDRSLEDIWKARLAARDAA